MPLICRGQGTAQVATDHANPPKCKVPSTQTSDESSANVFVEGVGVVRLGDTMNPHSTPTQNCAPHTPPLDSASPNVFANGIAIGRVGDTYAGPGTHVITDVGQSTVTAN